MHSAREIFNLQNMFSNLFEERLPQVARACNPSLLTAGVR